MTMTMTRYNIEVVIRVLHRRMHLNSGFKQEFTVPQLYKGP